MDVDCRANEVMVCCDSRGVHEEVDDGVDGGVGHGEPVEGEVHVLRTKDRLARRNSALLPTLFCHLGEDIALSLD